MLAALLESGNHDGVDVAHGPSAATDRGIPRSSAHDREDIEKLQEETRDRYGPLPEKVLQFLEYWCFRNQVLVAAA